MIHKFNKKKEINLKLKDEPQEIKIINPNKELQNFVVFVNSRKEYNKLSGGVCNE